MSEAVACVGLGAAGTSALVWHSQMGLFLSVSRFLSLSFRTKCSHTTIGKTASVACILYMALGSLGLILPKRCLGNQVSIFLVLWSRRVRDFSLSVDCFILTVSDLLRNNLVSYIHPSSIKCSSVLWADLFLFACFLLLDFRVTLVKKKGKKNLIQIPTPFCFQKIP